MAPTHDKFIFDKIWKFQTFESVLCFGIIVLILLAGLVVWVFMCCKKGCRCNCNADYDDIDETPRCGCTQNLIHSLLMGLMPELFSKHVQQRTTKNEQQQPGNVQIPTPTQIPGEENEWCNPTTELYLIGDKAFDEPPRCCNKKRACCYTYTYFVTTCALAFVWFVLVTSEYGIYRKTGTCNDIDVLDVSYSCFIVKDNGEIGDHINCTVGKDPNITVFCYLHSPNPGAVGIGFSFAKLILFGVTLYFKLTTKIAETSCGWVIVLQVLLSIAAFIGIAVLLPLIHYVKVINIYVYFFHGNAALRLASYALLILTPIFLIPVPWCFFINNKKYRSPVREVEV